LAIEFFAVDNSGCYGIVEETGLICFNGHEPILCPAANCPAANCPAPISVSFDCVFILFRIILFVFIF
jgi:hypothetical protein